MNKIYIVGIGYKPLDKKARGIVLNSEILLASNRLLDVFKGYDEYERVKDKIKVINNVDETMDFIRRQITDCRTQNTDPPTHPSPSRGEGKGGEESLGSELCALGSDIVLLASGDPMFFGIGIRVVNEFGKDTVEIFPDLSSIQVAFSKIKEPWDDVFFMSLHGGPDPTKRRRLEYEIEDIPALPLRHNKIALLTDKENNPTEIAKVLNFSPLTSHFSLVVYVCERLGYPDEKIIEGTPQDIVKMSFSDPNVVIIKNIPPTHPSPSRGEGKGGGESLASQIRFGLKESELLHSGGLITKDEVRAVTIHKLRLPQKGVLWDIGAGSGSISVEVARLCPELKVFAIEKDERQIENINENKKRFNVINIEVIKGEAPDAFEGLPAPDRALIGGSGGRLKEIIAFIAKMTTKIVVINATTIETLNEATQHLEINGFGIDVFGVSVSRSKNVRGKMHLQALNPVFIVIGERM